MRRRAVIVGATVLVVLALVGVAVLAGDEGGETASRSEAGTSEASSSTTAAGDAGGEATTSSTAAGDRPLPTSLATTTTAPTTTSIVISPPIGSTVPGATPPGSGGSGPNAAPVITSAVLQGSQTMHTTCNPDDARRTLTVSASDDRGVATVLLRWEHSAQGPGEAPMLRVGESWLASFGRFDEPGTVTYEAVATDANGATATSSKGTVTVQACTG